MGYSLIQANEKHCGSCFMYLQFKSMEMESSRGGLSSSEFVERHEYLLIKSFLDNFFNLSSFLTTIVSMISYSESTISRPSLNHKTEGSGFPVRYNTYKHDSDH